METATDRTLTYDSVLTQSLVLLQRYTTLGLEQIGTLGRLGAQEQDLEARTRSLGAAIEDGVRAFTDLGDSGSRLGSMLSGSLQGIDQSLHNEAWNIAGDTVRGFIGGLDASQSTLTSELENLLGGVLNTMRAVLGVHSPSTITATMGADLVAGLRVGVTDNVGEAEAALRQASQTLLAGVQSGLTGPALQGLTSSFWAKFSAVAQQQQQQAAAAVLAAAKSDIQTQVQALTAGIAASDPYSVLIHQVAAGSQDAANQLRQGLANGTIAQDGIAGINALFAALGRQAQAQASLLGQSVAQGITQVTAKAMDPALQQQQQAAVAAAQAAQDAVQATLGTMRGTDLVAPGGLATQIAGGSTAAMQQVMDMMAAGKIAPEAYQSLGNLINAERTKLAAQAAESGQAVVDGLTAGLTQDAAAMQAITVSGQAVIAHLNAVLGVASPSTKTMAMGRFLMAGLVLGIDGSRGDAVAAMQRAAAAVGRVPFTGPTSGAANISATASNGAQSQPVQLTVHVDVHGSVLTDRDLVLAVKQGLIADGRINGTFWKSL